MEILEKDVNNFMTSFCDWGYSDIERALEVFREAGKTDDELTEAVKQFCGDTDTDFYDADICCIAYDTLQQEARTEIENATGKDISNDKPFYSVVVYGNYMCTDFDGTDEAREATKNLIDTMEEKSEVVQWYYNQL